MRKIPGILHSILFISIVLLASPDGSGQNGRIYIDTVYAQPGDTVISSFYVQNVSGAGSVSMIIHYNQNVAQILGLAGNCPLNPSSYLINTTLPGEIYFSWFDMTPLPYPGIQPLLQFRFRYLMDSTALQIDPVTFAITTVNGTFLSIPYYPGFIMSCPLTTVSSPPDCSVISGSNAVFTATQPGIPNLSYEWQESTDNGLNWLSLAQSGPYSGVLTDELHISPATLSLNQRKYRCRLTSGCTKYTAPALLTVVSPKITGSVEYNNLFSTPVSQCQLTLKQANQVIAQTSTNAAGDFIFNDFPLGTYTVETQITKPWGGGNSVDALLILKHFVGLSVLTGDSLSVADVNMDSNITSLDALFIVRRQVGIISSFPSGDWLVPPQQITFTNPVTQTLLLKAQCFGDVNGSNIP
jgi:hypothetical protein